MGGSDRQWCGLLVFDTRVGESIWTLSTTSPSGLVFFSFPFFVTFCSSLREEARVCVSIERTSIRIPKLHRSGTKRVNLRERDRENNDEVRDALLYRVANASTLRTINWTAYRQQSHHALPPPVQLAIPAFIDPPSL